MKSKVILVSIAALAVLAALTVTGVKIMYREISDEKSFSLEGVNEIHITAVSTAVHLVRTETGNEARFHFHGKSLQEIRLVSEIRDKTLSVKPERKYFLLGTAENTHLDVYLPAGYKQKISLKTSSGAVLVDSFELEGFTLRTTSGGLEADTINARIIDLSTSSGKLKVKKLYGHELEIKGTSSAINIGESSVDEARVRNTSGGIILANHSGNLDIQSTSANVQVNCRGFNNRIIAAETTSGSITLGLPEDAGFLIEARTTSGQIHSDFALDTEVSDRTKISGRTGTAENRISIHSKSGQIKVVKNEG